MKQLPRINIVVPSYRRPDVLVDCLSALKKQTLTDFSVLCVCRPTDVETRQIVAAFTVQDSRFVEVIVDKPGLVEALNVGLRQAVAEFVTFTDDDAEAPPHWLATVVEHFNQHPECGAVGGRDWLKIDEPALESPSAVKRVGVYSWFGRFSASHHCPIEKEFVRCALLKGVNMSFRRALVKDVLIGEGLRGEQCAHGTESSLCAAVSRLGGEVHFVNDAWVLHHCAPRPQNDERTSGTSQYAYDNTFNYAYVLWRYQPLRTAIAAHMWGLLAGSKAKLGLVQLLRRPCKWRQFFLHANTALEGAKKGWLDRPADDALLKNK
jgi:GT2 family glycosyltransferase